MIEDEKSNTKVEFERTQTPVRETYPPFTSPHHSTSLVKRGLLILCIILLGLGSGFIGALIYKSIDSTSSTNQTITDGNKIITKEEEDVANVISKVSPSIVSIVTQSSNGYGYGEEGAGTGIIVGKEGYVLTNKHVIEGANTLSIVLTDGTTYKDVKVLGTDPLNDLAFLKISGVSNLSSASLGDSSSIRVGQKVIAIGNSLGQYQNTVTSGIISGVGRPVSAQSGNSVENLTDLIQTDTAINPGNSGGPLLNSQGQVIGINTAIAENAQGIGFAIPINSSKGILKGVLTGGEVKRGYLGINYLNIDADVVDKYGLTVKRGAYVYNDESKNAVVSDSPAAKAGLKDKDIITKVNNEEVGNPVGLSSLIAAYAPGDTVGLTVLRDDKTITIKVILGTYNN
jgi:serine protease Do